MEQEQFKNPNQAMNEMMKRIDLMRDVYVRETEALESADTNTFLSLQDEKVARAGEYQQGIEYILKRKDEMRKADPVLKKKLQRMQADFAALADKNMGALKRMQRCSERLGGTLRNAAKETVKKQNSFSYDQTGTMNAIDKKLVSTGISETV